MIATKIVNTALAALGQEPVPDLEEASLQKSAAATKLMRHLDDARDTVLRRHGWLCALEYVTLPPALIDGYVNWRFPAVYLLPKNALRVWEIGGVAFDGRETCWSPRWQVGSHEVEDASQILIRASKTEPSLNVAYVRRANWTALDSHVVDAMGFEVASRGAYQVTGDLNRASQLNKRAEEKVLLAISVEATEEGGAPPLMSSIPAAIRNMSR